MFEARVADYYRAKGYAVHERPRIRGRSENVYTVPMVAEGPLGSLLVSFGDAGGIDAMEIGRVRTMARDVGATPVVAAPNLDAELRRVAAQMAVVVVDDATVGETGPLPRELPTVEADPMKRDLDMHPWPASGRAFSLAGPVAVQARDVDEMVSSLHAREAPARQPPPAAAPQERFAWLKGSAPLAPPRAPAESQGPAPVVTVTSGATPQALQKGPSPPSPPNGPVDLSAFFGRRPTPVAPVSANAHPAPPSATAGLPASIPAPVTPFAPIEAPAVEMESSVMARRAMRERAVDMWDDAHDWPWKTIIAAGTGAVLLITLIRWLT